MFRSMPLRDAPPRAATDAAAAPRRETRTRPVLPPGIEELFLAAATRRACAYAPALLGTVALHYSDARLDLDEWRDVTFLAPLDEDDGADPWARATVLAAGEAALAREPAADATFAPLPAAAARASSYTKWAKALAAHARRRAPLRLWRTTDPELVSRAGESEAELVARARDAMRAQRDDEVERVRMKLAPKLARLRERIRAAEDRVERERSQYEGQRTQTAISLGATVLGAVLGRRLGGGSVGRATTAARSAGRASRAREDVRRAAEALDELRTQLAQLEAETEKQIAAVRRMPGEMRAEPFELAPRKSDLQVRRVSLVWVPSDDLS